MKTMMIIDDEVMVRRGIRETIDWALYDISIIGEATNGKEGLSMIHQLHPDLVISDIKMPIMDGVELVKSIQKDHLDLAVIILSGYKDFDFAKGALENGAVEYLLKPIDNQDLIDSVIRASKKLDAIRNLSNKYNLISEELPELKNQLFNRILAGEQVENLSEKLSLYQLDIPSSGLLVYGMVDHPELYINSKSIAEINYELYQTVISQTRQSNCYPFHYFLNQSFVLIFDQEKSCERISAMMHEGLNLFSSIHSDTASIIMSGPYLNLNELSLYYQKAKKSAFNKLYPGMNTVFTSDDTIDQMKPIIIKTMEYISKNYHRNLSVKMVTDALYVSESYLLHLFKENVGKTFNETLSDYRIMVAKKLLSQNTYKVYEVSEMVGYSDVKYFSQIFKKKTNMTPSEYAEKMGGQKS